MNKRVVVYCMVGNDIEVFIARLYVEVRQAYGKINRYQEPDYFINELFVGIFQNKLAHEAKSNLLAVQIGVSALNLGEA